MKLLKEEIVTMDILRRQGESNQAIAKRLGITEGTVRYHLKRMDQNAKDGRSKCSFIEQLDLVEAVDFWWKEQLESLPKDRSPNVTELWTYLLRAELWSYNPPFLNRIVIVVRSVFYSVNSASLHPASAARSSPPNIVPRHYPALF